MSLLPVHHRSGSLLPDFTDLWNSFLQPGSSMLGPRLLRVEDTVENDKYVVRAEIPGVDPAKDVQVSVQSGVLTIKAERTEKHEEKGHSEFSYGSFTRSVTLPAGAVENDIDASYAKGILTIAVPLGETPAEARMVEVKSAE